MTAAATSGSAYWYLTRGSGAVSLVLLTASVALGVVNVQRWRARGWPRFVTDRLHRNVSLLVLVFLALHILTAIVDGFVPISVRDVFVPFGGAYRPLWLGLGAVAFDLLLALTITSVLRSRIGWRGWRAVHWTAYACWPVALIHGLGTGSDASRPWMLGLVAACAATVWLSVWIRVAGASARAPRRFGAVAGLVASPLALVAWLPNGPLGANWARRAGTPATVLAKTGTPASASTRTATAQATNALSPPFTASLSGTVGESPAGQGDLAAVDMPMHLGGGVSGRLRIRIVGQPLSGGGVTMQDSDVTLGPLSDPGLYSGRVVSLNGSEIVASLARRDGRALQVRARLNIDSRSASVTGRLNAGALAGAGA